MPSRSIDVTRTSPAPCRVVASAAHSTASQPVPVIASGGAGTPAHFAEALTDGRADAVLAASRWHDGDLTIREVKEHLAARGIPVRL